MIADNAPGTDAPLRWRPMVARDLDCVLGVAAEVHPDYPEDAAVFAERLARAPAGCHVAAYPGISAYVISHPWLMRAPPKLNSFLGALPATPDCWYIHDLAVRRSARGGGLGASAVARVADVARRAGLRRMALVALPGSSAFWERQGFHLASGAPAELASYGADVQLMVKG